MIEIWRKEYWSKSEAFLLPLTGLSRSQKYPLSSFLFWENYSIEDYNLTVTMKYDNYEEFLEYCKKIIFPTLDEGGYLVESHDYNSQSVFVLDMSEWALDIEMFLKGKYSKMSKDAKEVVKEYHTFFDKGPKKPIHISMALDPYDKFPLLGGMIAIEYVAENYGISTDELKKIGELASLYDKEKETLTILTDKPVIVTDI